MNNFCFTENPDAPLVAEKDDMIVGNIHLLKLEEADRHLPTGEDTGHMWRLIEAVTFAYVKALKLTEYECRGLPHRRAERKAERDATTLIQNDLYPVSRSGDYKPIIRSD